MTRLAGIAGNAARPRSGAAKGKPAKAGQLVADQPPLWVGTRLRHARLVKEYRIRDVADRVGCSMSVISKIENGKATPSLTLLHRLVHVLGINIGALFETKEDEGAPIARAGARPVMAMERDGGGVALERLVPYGDSHLLQGNIHIVAPGAGSDGGIKHEGEEVGYVLEGDLVLTLDGRSYTLHVGDSFVFRSHRKHGYRNPGKTPTRILWINTPPTF